MEFSPNNPIVKLCVQGMSFSASGRAEEARDAFLAAWRDASNDLEQFLSAYFLARYEHRTEIRLEWFKRSLEFARRMDGDIGVAGSLPVLYAEIATCYRELNDHVSARAYSELAEASEVLPQDPGPFYHGTRARLAVGDLLRPGGNSNYKDGIVMNHIYFTAMLFGAGLAASLAKGDGSERVYVVEPTGSYEDDPNVTNKRFPGNLTRSYRSAAPLKIVGEVTEWPRQTPDELRAFRERLSSSKGEIIN